MERDSFVFYRSFYEAILEIQDKALRMDCFDAIVMYALYGVEPKEGSEIVQMVFKLVKPQIDANNRKYENGKKGAEFGKLGGRPKKANNPLGVINENTLGVLSETPNVNVNDNVNVNVKERDKRENKGAKAPPSQFKKPTVDEVSQYIRENGYHVDPNSFVDFYTSKGWKVGKEPMKDWKACVRTWERRESPGNKKVTQFQQNNYDFGLLEEQLLDN